MNAEQQLPHCQIEPQAIVERRSANYKPNIWKYDFIETLNSNYDGKDFKRQAEELKKGVKHKLVKSTMDQLAKLELVDRITKLGLAYLFEREIREALDTVVASFSSRNIPGIEVGLYATSLYFRLLRQYGYQVSDGMFGCFVEEKVKRADIKGMLELFEASELNSSSESILEKAKAFSVEALQEIRKHSFRDENLAEEVNHALLLSSHKRVNWFDIKWLMNLYEKSPNVDAILLGLAKLNFNIVQAVLQNDLRDISRWWRDLGLVENLDFTRDRLVESFMCAVGLVVEPRYKSFRKWLTKVVTFILVIDDVYDLYGSLEELQCFTTAVDRWDVKEIEQLPECMKICFYALYNTTNDTAREIQKENGWDGVLPHLTKAWADFCKSLLMEAKWYNERYIPSLEEYLSNAWISSGGSTILRHALFAITNNEDVLTDKEMANFLEKSHHLVYNSSLIIRLCNDLGTSDAEQERGDAASSIICCMQEMNVSEEKARDHIKNMIDNAWKELNGVECFNHSPSMQKFVDITKNAARVAHNLYQHGDGFGIQDREIRTQIKSLIVEPFKLHY